MAYIAWSDEFSTGINVIDSQHKRIIHYINQLNDAQNLNDPELISEILLNLIDYTFSHFAFEETLMDEAGYIGASIHKQTHDGFSEKIKDFQKKHQAGIDVSGDLLELLNVWLINHIAEDDSTYAPVVKQNINGINTVEKQGWIKTMTQRFFN
jgi:hemerythrin